MGNSSSAHFRTVVESLWTTPIAEGAEGEAAFWDSIIPSSPVSTMEYFTAIQPESVREILAEHPRNLALVLLKCLEVLHDTSSSHVADSPGRFLNAVRLLTRLLPVIFEEGESAEFVENFFWENMVPVRPGASAAAPAAVAAAAPAQEGGAGAEGGAASASASAALPPPPPPPPARPSSPATFVSSSGCVWEELPELEPPMALGAALVHAVMGCLFVQDVTITSEQIFSFGSKLAYARGKAEARASLQARIAALAEGEQLTLTEEESRDAAADAEGEVIADEANAVWPMLLWKGGVGFPRLQAFPATTAMLAARIDVLRLLIALCSQTLYAPPVPSAPPRSRFLDVATAASCPFAPTTFYCLLNAILGYDPVGLGVPYANKIVGDKEEPFVAVALQAFLVFLDYAPLVPDLAAAEEQQEGAAAAAAAAVAAAAGAADGQGVVAPPPAPSGDGDGDASTSAAAAPSPSSPPPRLVQQFNIYRSLVAGLNTAADFDTVFDGITRILSTVPSAEQSMLPGAYSAPAIAQEVLVLLWKLLDESPEFAKYVLDHCDITLVVSPILYLMWMGRNNITKVGLIHLCTFALLLLSGERSFGVALNRTFEGKLPPDMPLFAGSYADLLLIVMHKLVVDGSTKLSTLYSFFLTIIGNASPYMKNLSLVGTMRLVNLFELFASPRFLFASPHNFSFVHQLLDILNNLIQYQYESNPVLIYSVIRRREVFDRLGTVTVSAWKAENAFRAAKKAGLSEEQAAAAAAAAAATASGLAAGDVGAVAAAAAAVGASGRVHGSSATAAAVAAGGEDEGAFADKMEQVHASGTAPAAAAAAAATAAAVVPSSSSSSSAAAAAKAAAAPALPASGSVAWTATDQWLDDVRAQLPLGTCQRLIAYIAPLIEEHILASGGNVDDEGVVTFLKATTVVGILPVPHVILMRKYQPNEYTSLWFTTFLWSTIFLHLCKEVPMFDAAAIKLFTITVV